ncbi:MAG: hypothetical protein HC913_21170 [Microscillaceae bacterium]|nr:hypothetical protein [Microscillaceae bacterium]
MAFPASWDKILMAFNFGKARNLTEVLGFNAPLPLRDGFRPVFLPGPEWTNFVSLLANRPQDAYEK